MLFYLLLFEVIGGSFCLWGVVLEMKDLCEFSISASFMISARFLFTIDFLVFVFLFMFLLLLNLNFFMLSMCVMWLN